MSLGTSSLAEVSLAELPTGLQAPVGIGHYYLGTMFYGPGEVESDLLEIWLPRILGDVEINQQGMSLGGAGGRVALNFSEVMLDDVDNWTELLARYDLASGLKCDIFVAEVKDLRSIDLGLSRADDVHLSFSGLTRNVTQISAGRSRLAISDIGSNLEIPAQSTKYTGLGGLNGGDELKDKPKPIALGRCFNVAPIALGNQDLGDGSLPTFQSHWRRVRGHEEVRIRGVVQTEKTSPGAPVPGQWKDWPELGCFQLGGSPDGDVTADLEGDDGSSYPYVSSTAGIIKLLLTDYGAQFPLAQINLDSFEFADTDIPGEIGLFQGAETITVDQLIQRICAGSGAVLSGGRDGRFFLADPLVETDNQFELESSDIVDLRPMDLPTNLSPAPQTIEFLWQPNFTPLANLAGSVTGADREKLGKEGQVISLISSIVSQRNTKNAVLKLISLFWNEADAQARAQKWQTWIESGLSCYSVTTDRYLDQFEIGHYGQVTYPRFGLERGFRGVVLGVSEKLAGGRVTVTMIGKKL